MLNHVVNVGWTVWWHLTDRERIEIEWAWRRSAFYSYRDDPKRLWAFIQRAIALNTGHSLAVAAVLIDLAGHRMQQHEGFALPSMRRRDTPLSAVRQVVGLSAHALRFLSSTNGTAIEAHSTDEALPDSAVIALAKTGPMREVRYVLRPIPRTHALVGARRCLCV
jgi:hypothetical protein